MTPIAIARSWGFRTFPGHLSRKIETSLYPLPLPIPILRLQGRLTVQMSTTKRITRVRAGHRDRRLRHWIPHATMEAAIATAPYNAIGLPPFLLSLPKKPSITAFPLPCATTNQFKYTQAPTLAIPKSRPSLRQLWERESCRGPAEATCSQGELG